MEKICRACKHSDPLPVKFTNDSLRVQGRMAAERQKVAGQGKAARLIAVGKVVALPEYGEHRKLHGAFSLSKKTTDTDGNYVTCSEPGHLEDVKAKKEGIVHKYYFSCDHFKGRE